MIKFLIITFNAFLFFIISIFSGADGISITSNLPKNMSPGQEVEVEVKITKGGLGGFAKFQLEMPEGFTATEVDSKGANYSFATGLAKWVWPALPTESDVVIKFKLKADASMSGAKSVGGKFSYVENNAKQVVEMPAVEIMIGGDGAVATENNSTPTNTTSSSTPTVANTTPTVASTPTVANTTPTVASTPTTEVAATTPTVSLNDEPGANVTVVRNIKPGSNADEHLVELKISKGSIKGFAKFSDDLPAGYTAKSVNTSESSFSVADGKIKFVWVTLPSKEEITISYLLSGRSMSMVELTGEFSYLANDQSKKFIMQKVTIPNTPSAEIAQTPTSTPTMTETPTNTVVTTPTNTEVAVTTNTVTPTATETPTNTGNNNTDNTATNITENRSGSINYRVQIGAFSNASVTSGTLARKFGVKGNIISEMQAGLNKFMVGNHNEYKDARDQRETIKPAINSAFVVAYNGSKRVTVQEALMLTNQKWFK
jgi:cell division septation protein DedD